MRLVQILLAVVFLAYNANSQTATSFYLSAGSNSMTAFSCGVGQNVNVYLQAWSNSSFYFYTGVPQPISVPCSFLNFSLVQGASLGPAILGSFSKCVAVSNPSSFCVGFANVGLGAGVAQVNINSLLSVTCGCTIPPVETADPLLIPDDFEFDRTSTPTNMVKHSHESEKPFDRLVRLLSL